MKRRKGSGRFNTGGYAGEDINPMDGLANLADVMLVFACGLMLALITYWNVDVATVTNGTADVQNQQEITQDISDAENGDADSVSEDGLQQYGMVYIDPETGKLYMVTEGGNE